MSVFKDYHWAEGAVLDVVLSSGMFLRDATVEASPLAGLDVPTIGESPWRLRVGRDLWSVDPVHVAAVVRHSDRSEP